MQLFYAPRLVSGEYFLDEEESKHCTKVLRLRAGDTIHLVDGKGGFYEARLKETGKHCSFEIISSEKEKGKRSFLLHMAVAPTKNTERFEWFLEKAAELGIDEISPLLCERSERTSVKPERLNKVLTSAMKQSLKAYLPQLHPASEFRNLIRTDFQGQKFIAHCASGNKVHLKEAYKAGSPCLILIGPEGDFSDAEIKEALKKGFTEVHLGPSRLRTETAALAACHTVNLLSE